MKNLSIEKFWDAFIKNHPEYMDKEYRDSYYFCDNEKDANECAELVLRGVKRATASSQWWHEQYKEPLPEIGDINIVTDWENRPLAVIRTTKVNLVPFNKVSEAFAATEGEGDGSLEYWKRVHWDYYTREMSASGKQASEEMVIVCEEFERIDG